VLAEREGHVDEAVSEYAAALNIDPTVARAAINLGVLVARRGDLENAEMLLEKGVALDPRSARGFLALGQIQQIRGDPAGACTLFARAWKADSTFLKALESLATAAYAVGDTAAAPPLAAQLIRRAGLDDPLSTRCRFILGRMQERHRFGWAVWSSIECAEGDLALSLRDLERAPALYNDALAKNPGDLAAILELARIAATRGDSAETAGLVSRFLARGGPPAAVAALRQ
jgi:Tfp pilus assembly protein PilF